MNIDDGARGVSTVFLVDDEKSRLKRPFARCKKARPDVGPMYWPSTFVASLPGELRNERTACAAASGCRDSDVETARASLGKVTGCGCWGWLTGQFDWRSRGIEFPRGGNEG